MQMWNLVSINQEKKGKLLSFLRKKLSNKDPLHGLAYSKPIA